MWCKGIIKSVNKKKKTVINVKPLTFITEINEYSSFRRKRKKHFWGFINFLR